MQQHQLKQCLTPPEIARRWRIKPDCVVMMIKSGELRGFDVSSNPGSGRPRYRVMLSDVEDFEDRRNGKSVEEKQKTKKRLPKTPPDYVQYY